MRSLPFRLPMHDAVTRKPAALQLSSTRFGILRRTCSTAPSSSLNNGRERIVAERIRLPRSRRSGRRRHFAQRRQQTAIGTVVIGQQQTRFVQICITAKKACNAGGSSRSGASPDLAVNLRQRRTAETILAAAEIDQQSDRSRRGRCAIAASGSGARPAPARRRR